MTRKAVLDLRDARPVWRVPDDVLARIASAFGAGWDVVTVSSPTDGRGDGAGGSPEALAAVTGSEVYIGFGMSRPLFLAATTPRNCLRWVHSATAGIGAMLYDEMRAADLVLTNSAGVHAPAMAETALAMMLHFARGLDVAVHGQQRTEWLAREFERSPPPARELAGATLGIVGLGGIGGEIAWRARALGMRVLGVRRGAAEGPTGVEVLRGADAPGRLLAESDYVALCVPATAETRGMIGPAELDRMRPGAVLVSVGRGDVIADEGALVHALETGRLRGAGLDVFREEPLPPDSPLWRLPNVLITPHVSATSDRFWERESELILENVRRYIAGVGLLNVVDRARGY